MAAMPTEKTARMSPTSMDGRTALDFKSAAAKQNITVEENTMSIPIAGVGVTCLSSLATGNEDTIAL